jgi:acyl carrier protein
MMTIAVTHKVIEIVSEQFGVDARTVRLTNSFVEDFGADSLDGVELTLTLEDVFGIEIPAQDVQKIRTVGQAIRYIKHRTGGAC